MRVLPQGLYCEPGDFFVDPQAGVPRAVISHGHSDHARPGHDSVLATPETLAIMNLRLGTAAAGRVQQPLAYGRAIEQNGVRITLLPAGHVLGSAQVMLEWQGSRIVVSGDYKRQPDPTCRPFEPVPCDVFVTEATFALPVFRHPPAQVEVRRLLDSMALFPQRTHLVGCYALGKCQRLIAELRAAGYDRPIYLHGAQANVCALYEHFGAKLGELLPVPRPTRRGETVLPGEVVLAPPSADASPWARRLADPVTCLASGWMRVRQRAKARGVELPLVVSDHADWPDLLQTIEEVGAPEVWVTHGREEALIHALAQRGVRGRALHLLGREEDEVEADLPLQEVEA
ncbi:ligase-associated DNA damage response exonuclease [Roseomonas marmotae]|uniref:Ligase-associated DNA damage response exonuclease n=1 Tax=Roseomonas marmotae TaxID=2768161 RepID=A0ABS3KA64_9PROT|nr:ligase-associated DNA damage response exonuclease [Roseomonas marmotae]QTI80958.1 ligase-associated DNA damage response exonuclease [Roseomonas marmotae]